MISRRGFLLSASAAAIAAAMPMPIASMAVAAPATPAAAPLLAFAVGTPGEYDWQSIFATDAEAAWRIWGEDAGGFDDYEEDDLPAFDPDMVTRVPGWDGLKTISSGDWFAVGLGHVCDRCGYEASPEDNGMVVDGDVVCDDCLTFADRLKVDHEWVEDDLANRIYDEGESEVKAWLVAKNHWDNVPRELWARSLKQASP